MDLGLLFSFRNPPHWRRPFPEFYAEMLRHMRLADELGYDHIWMTEHHFTEDGYAPSLMPLAAAAAVATQRIRIGTYVLLLPLHNAITIAEEAATVDILSDGRFDLGLGAGYAPDEFKGYGVSLSERASRMEEGLQVIKGLWTQEEFSFEGKHYRIENARLMPRPVQAPHVPIWVGAIGPKAIDRSARFGCHHFGVDETIAAHNEALRRHGRDPRQFCSGVLRWVYVAPTGDEAWNDTQDHLHYMLSWYVRWGGENQVKGDATAPQIRPASELRHCADKLIGAPIIGAPEEIIEKLLHMRKNSEVTHLAMGMHLPGLDPAKIRRSMELFAKEVMPTLR